MQALAERLGEFGSGRVLEKADLLSFSSLKTFSPAVEELYGQILESVARRAKYLVWNFPTGSRIVLHLSQAGRVDVESPPKTTRPRGSVARFILSDPSGADGRARRSSSGSTEPSARPHGGCWLPETTGHWRGWVPNRTPSVRRTDPHEH